MIKQTLLFPSICAVVLAGALSVRAAERMAAGQWAFTLTGNGESRTMKQCMTPDQANEMNGDILYDAALIPSPCSCPSAVVLVVDGPPCFQQGGSFVQTKPTN